MTLVVFYYSLSSFILLSSSFKIVQITTNYNKTLSTNSRRNASRNPDFLNTRLPPPFSSNRKFSRCQKAVRMALELRFISDCQRSCDPSRENTAGFYDTCVISGKFFKKMKFELSKIGDFFFFSSLLSNNRESSRTNKFERSIQNDRFRCLYRVSNFYFV